MQAQRPEEMYQAMIGHDRPVKTDVHRLDDLHWVLVGPAVLSGSVRLA
jgi:hypothetical protein